MAKLARSDDNPPKPRRRLSAPRLVFHICSGLFCVALLAWFAHSVRQEGRWRRCGVCTGNFKWISISLHRYHEKYGHFPPAYIADKDGKPLHSWRVLLLEFNEDPLYKAYRFDEPWNGPNNRKLASLMPAFYACPNDHDIRDAPTVLTSYVAVTGMETAFPYGNSTQIKSISNGLDETVFIIETKDSGINWMEPRDIDVANLNFPAKPGQHPALSSNDPSGPGLAFGSSRLERVKHPMQQAVLKAMSTISGDRSGGGLRGQ